MIYTWPAIKSSPVDILATQNVLKLGDVLMSTAPDPWCGIDTATGESFPVEEGDHLIVWALDYGTVVLMHISGKKFIAHNDSMLIRGLHEYVKKIE